LESAQLSLKRRGVERVQRRRALSSIFSSAP
jgi:hypothetical protein